MVITRNGSACNSDSSSRRTEGPPRRSKIAFIKHEGWSNINSHVLRVMQHHFKDHEFLVIDVGEEFLNRPGMWLRNHVRVWLEFAPDLISGQRTHSECAFRTPWVFHQIKDWLANRLAKEKSNLLFTFQTQSMFDASVEGVPHFVFTDHTQLVNLTYPDFDPRLLFSRRWLELEKQIYRNARNIFTMGQHVADSLVWDYACAPEQVSCVHGGSNVPIQEPDTNLDRYQRKRILFNGIQWERKGGPELAKAFKLVLERHPDAKLTVLGCKPGLGLPNCTELGLRPLAEVPAAYAQASIFCMPSRIEPFGIAVVEAMLNGLPVVTTRIGAMPDMIQDGTNGHLIPPSDVKALAEKLIQLLDSPETCKEMGEASRVRAKGSFTWEAVGTKLHAGIEGSLRHELRHKAPEVAANQKPVLNFGISVVIPAFNYAHFLPDAIRSVLAQNVAPLEVIVVDDGSTDNTHEVVMRFGEKVRYLHQANAGLSAARNTGIQAASHDWIALLDADDEFEPCMLETLAWRASTLSGSHGLVACGSSRMDIHRQLIPRKRLEPNMPRNICASEILLRNQFVADAVLFRRGVVLQAGGFDTALTSSEDRDMWLRMALLCKILLVPEPLVRIREHGNSMSRNARRMGDNMRRVHKKAWRAGVVPRWDLFFWAKARAFLLYQTAWMYRDAGSLSKSLFDLMKSMLLYPIFLNPHRLNENYFFRLRSMAQFIAEMLKMK